jgi:hypothetical protein
MQDAKLEIPFVDSAFFDQILDLKKSHIDHMYEDNFQVDLVYTQILQVETLARATHSLAIHLHKIAEGLGYIERKLDNIADKLDRTNDKLSTMIVTGTR